MDNSNTFSIYSDETGLFDKRFQAIGLVSGPTVHLLELRDKLRLILNENCITEIKFVEVRTHHPKLLAAQGFIERSVTEYANRQKCRIDVLVWDTQDLRRAIRGRDDVANLGIMSPTSLRRTEQLFYATSPTSVRKNHMSPFQFCSVY
jgi:hypothetical protein